MRRNPTRSAMCPIRKARPWWTGPGQFPAKPGKRQTTSGESLHSIRRSFRVVTFATWTSVRRVQRPIRHNGYLKSLKEVVHFYNTRDTLPDADGVAGRESVMLAASRIPNNINTIAAISALRQQEDDLVVFSRPSLTGYKQP